MLGYSYQKLIDTVVVDQKAVISLPESVSVADAVSLPTAILSAWVGLVEVGGIGGNSIVMVHDALSRMPLLFLVLEVFVLILG